jgi:hypothetical protein
MDVRPPQVCRGRGTNDLALEFPLDGTDVGGNQPQKVVSAFAALYGHVDVVMTLREVGSRPTATTG